MMIFGKRILSVTDRKEVMIIFNLKRNVFIARLNFHDITPIWQKEISVLTYLQVPFGLLTFFKCLQI